MTMLSLATVLLGVLPGFSFCQEAEPLVPQDAQDLIPGASLALVRLASMDALVQPILLSLGEPEGSRLEHAVFGSLLQAELVDLDRPAFLVLGAIDATDGSGGVPILAIVPTAKAAELQAALGFGGFQFRHTLGSGYLGFALDGEYPEPRGECSLGDQLTTDEVSGIFDCGALVSHYYSWINASLWGTKFVANQGIEGLSQQLRLNTNTTEWLEAQVTDLSLWILGVVNGIGDVELRLRIRGELLELHLDITHSENSPLATWASEPRLTFSDQLELELPGPGTSYWLGLDVGRLGSWMEPVLAGAAVDQIDMSQFAPALSELAQGLGFGLQIDWTSGAGAESVATLDLIGTNPGRLTEALAKFSAAESVATTGLTLVPTSGGPGQLKTQLDPKAIARSFHLMESDVFDIALDLGHFSGGLRFGVGDLKLPDKIHGGGTRLDLPLGFLELLGRTPIVAAEGTLQAERSQPLRAMQSVAAKRLGSCYPYVVETTDMRTSMIENFVDMDTGKSLLKPAEQRRLEDMDDQVLGYLGFRPQGIVSGWVMELRTMGQLLRLVVGE